MLPSKFNDDSSREHSITNIIDVPTPIQAIPSKMSERDFFPMGMTDDDINDRMLEKTPFEASDMGDMEPQLSV